MHEILSQLSQGWVLDLGSRYGSFPAEAFPFSTVRVDLDPPEGPRAANVVQADAARLPFKDGSFAAVISNHSMEHFERLDESLAEVGRVVAPGAGLFVSVPDASTFTDRVYRWLGQGGGHVNAFVSAEVLRGRIESATRLRHVGTRLLYSSLSFLNRKNIKGRLQRKMWLFARGDERFVVFLNWLTRIVDRWFGTRLSVYGWAFYFGEIAGPLVGGEWRNACARCGAGHPADQLEAQGAVGRSWLGVRMYRCPGCGAKNTFVRDDLAA